MRKRPSMNQRSTWVYMAVLATIGVSIFDFLRKTLLLEASWNYHYPEWTLVYNPVALLLLFFVLISIVILYDALLELNDRNFLLTIITLTIVLSILTLLATPIKSYKWAFQPHVQGPIETFQYHPSTIAAEEGLKTFFANFHSTPTLNGDDRIETTKYLTNQLQQAHYLPWNESWADYASNIVTQRHGPIPALLVAPFLWILGSSPTNAVIGSYTITLTLPIITFFILRPYFDEKLTRIGTTFVIMSPAYLIYQRYGTVSYDAITAVVAAIGIALFLDACRTKRKSHFILAGIVFSGAMLSKISILTMLPTFFILILIYSEGVRNIITSTTLFGISCLIVPFSLLPLGYNFIVQYLYDLARIQMGDGGSSGLFARLVSLYNVRLLGTVALCFALLFIISLAYRRPASLKERELVGLSFIPAILPFFLFKGITLSRHLLPLLPLIIFIGLCGICRRSKDSIELVEVKLLLAATICLILVNI